MHFEITSIDKCYVINHDIHLDERGKFSRIFSRDEFSLYGLHQDFPQLNWSFNKSKFTLRGMHYQDEETNEHKIITCIAGQIQLVMIDLRKNSRSYLSIISMVLNYNDTKSIFIPCGVATGWLTLKNQTSILYQMGSNYNPSRSKNFSYKDPLLNFPWLENPKIISKKDEGAENYCVSS